MLQTRTVKWYLLRHQLHRQDGFSLFEVAIALWLAALATAFTVPAWTHLARHQALAATTHSLVWNLRQQQTWAIAHASNATVNLYPYTPQYDIYHGANKVAHVTFAFDVNYVDGYLQMPSHRVSYGPGGWSNTMGTIALTDQSRTDTVHLYRGAGLQTMGGTT